MDKSLLIEEVITDAAKVLLIPRPRRFGKTLNLSMLRYFFEKSKEDRRGLFSGLSIEKSKEAWNHFQKYPVIFLTFKDVKANTWEDAFEGILFVLCRMYQDHRYLLDSNLLHPEETAFFQKVLEQKITPAQGTMALSTLSRYLHMYHGEKVVILVDEYDNCIHSAYTNGYYEEAISFFRNLLSGAFKDNPHLYKGVLTGILRVAKESIFSGLNHLAVYSLLKPEFSTCFGFTEAEVLELTQKMGHEELMTDIKSWYNGYLVGNTQIYNPWSTLNFLASQDKLFRPYWVSTADNQIIRKLLLEQGLPLQQDLKTLLQGGSIPKPIEEHISFVDLTWSEQAIWSFLLFAGYLTPEKTYKEGNKTYATLRLVNQEVVEDFTSLTQSWFEKQLSGSITVESLLQAIFSGNVEKVEETLSYLLKVNLSYHDVKRTKENQAQNSKEEKQKLVGKTTQKIDPESVYLGFVLGILSHLIATYEVRSNRESAYGRPDVMLIPKVAGKPGVVMECKVQKKQTLEGAFADAFTQLEQNDYKTELQERGAKPILEYAAVFTGKKVHIQLR